MQVEQVSRRDEKYLRLLRAGNPIRDIARKYHVTAKTVYNGLERARLAERPSTRTIPRPPRVVPSYSCRPFTPQTRCEDVHRGPIPAGSHIYCEPGACTCAEIARHPALKRDPRTDPRPERRSHSKSRLRGGVG
jgi:hypothetical protein